MRKILITLLAVSVLGVGAAFAQGMSSYWAGFSFGYPSAQVHFGVSDVAPGISLRANLGYGYLDYGFGVGVDALVAVPVDTGSLPLSVYAGVGPSVSFSYYGGAATAGTSIGVKAFAGAEYRLGEVGLPQGGVFFEAGPMMLITPSFTFVPVGRLGFNYHF